jgi:hypothetical protein
MQVRDGRRYDQRHPRRAGLRVHELHPNPDGHARAAVAVDHDVFFVEYFSRTIPG